MKFDYNEMLRQRIYGLQRESALSDYVFFVDSEQSFLKKKDLEPKSIYVLTRELQNDNGIGVDTQPVQILILTEQDSLEIAKGFFSEFAKRYNFEATSEVYYDNGVGKTAWVKQQYSDPVVLSNFNTVSYGYRSVLYVSATLYVMYDVVDLKDLVIDGEPYKALTFDFAYSMSPNTQQRSNEFISRSVKSVSTLSITLTLPVTISPLITKVLRIMDEADRYVLEGQPADGYGGNEEFDFSFSLGNYVFANKKMKLISADFGASVDNIPAIRMGFMK